MPGQTLPIIRELLFHLPVDLVDRRKTYDLRDAPAGVVATFIVRVESHMPPTTRGGKKPYKILCSNATGDLTLVFFHASTDYLMRALPVGQERVVSGMTEHFEYRLQMTHPDIIAPVGQLAEVQIVEPVYPLTAGLTNRRLSGLIAQVLENTPDLPEWVNPGMLQKHHFPAWKTSLALAHAPQSEAMLAPDHPTRMRLAYDEALAGQLHMARLRRHVKARGGRVIIPTHRVRPQLLARLPFTLTAGQQHMIAEIDADLASGKRMARLLQGDVGSGKTLVALMAALAAAENGLQTALMVPTELIAQQHAENFRRLCAALDIEIALLTGSQKGRAREETLSAIKDGRAHIVVGTHALFQEQVQFHSLALVIVDEQHRFGVAQRMTLLQKSTGDTAPHILQMTATPIPRSLTMTAYGDMDCSLLSEKPAGRTPVETRVVPLSRVEEVIGRIQPALARGEKIYWICPAIDSEQDDAATVARYALFTTMFGAEAGMVHGRMKPDLRDEHMRRFASGECRLLVATTVVEVGVDVPDATIIIIEQAERFGLSQLHQLRGRVGRGDKPSFCVLLYNDEAGEEARARLSTLRESQDGLAIAEADLRIRGGGDLLGTRQSGLPTFRFLSLSAHYTLIAEAREEAKAVIERDSALASDEGKALQMLLGLHGYPQGE